MTDIITHIDIHGNDVINIGLHIIILFTFLTLFFFMYISSVSSESIDNITNDIIKTNIKNLIKKIDDKDEKNLINWEIAKNVAITIENKYNTELPEITYNNTKLYNIAILCIILSILFLVGLGYYFDIIKKLNIKWGEIFKENFIIFSIIGIIEYLFFVNVAFKYVPVEPSTITNIILQKLKENINKFPLPSSEPSKH